jgi:hypothetical protein
MTNLFLFFEKPMTYLRDRGEAQDQDGHKLGEKPFLQPSEQDLQSLSPQQKQFQ